MTDTKSKDHALRASMSLLPSDSTKPQQEDHYDPGDLLLGADAIAEFILGDRRLRRRVYHLAAVGQLPHFRLGAKLCARKSVLLAWIKRQESKSVAGVHNE